MLLNYYGKYIVIKELPDASVSTEVNWKFTKITELKLYYFNYSKRTIKIYLYYIQKFIETIDNHHSRINTTVFSNYMLNYKFISNYQQNQIFNVINGMFQT